MTIKDAQQEMSQMLKCPNFQFDIFLLENTTFWVNFCHYNIDKMGCDEVACILSRLFYLRESCGGCLYGTSSNNDN